MKSTLMSALALSAVACVATSQNATTVRFQVLEYDSEQSYPYRVNEFYDRSTKRFLSERFDSSLSALDIPFGKYTYVLSRTDLPGKSESISGEVIIAEDRPLITVQAPPKDEFVPFVPIEGRFDTPIKDGRVRYVRLYHPMSNSFEETELVEGLRFSFRRGRVGQNILLLMADGKLLDAYAVHIRLNSTPVHLTLRYEGASAMH